MSSDKRKLINAYFNFDELDVSTLKNVAKYGIILLFLGILLLWLEQKEILGDFKIIAVIFIIVGLFSFWILVKPLVKSSKIFSSKAADGDMDIWFLEDLHEIIKPRALEQLKINPSGLKEENIIIVPLPVYWKGSSVDPGFINRVEGEDGSYIYSVWQVQILVVTENFISYYSCIFDWLNTKIEDERTNEFFFDDISSVRNDVILIEKIKIDTEEEHVGEAKVFILTNMSGDKLTVITDIPSFKVPEGYSNNLEKLVQAIRILLRNRRYGEEIEVTKQPEIIDDKIEFEIENTTTDNDKVLFHQQLRDLYNDYNQDSADE